MIDTARALRVITEQIDAGTFAKKCHGCGCFQQTVIALGATVLGAHDLAPTLGRAKAVFEPKKYDCLGCAVCFPALAANVFAEAFPGAGDVMDLCPTEAPARVEGWPPLPGDYKTLRYAAAVAVCTLNSPELIPMLATGAPDVLAIVGTMHTENLGIERLIQNIVSNPNVRFLVLCGEDSRPSSCPTRQATSSSIPIAAPDAFVSSTSPTPGSSRASSRAPRLPPSTPRSSSAA